MRKIEYLLMCLLAIGILSGCGTKKKVLSKEKEKTEITTELETQTEQIQVTEEKEETQKTSDSVAEKKQVTITDTQEKDFDPLLEKVNEKRKPSIKPEDLPF